MSAFSASTYRRGGLGTRGTRFRLYAQAPLQSARRQPEVVWVSPSAGSVHPGPADERMYVVDAVHKDRAYDEGDLPPYRGATNPPVPPGPASPGGPRGPGPRRPR